jgi:hypothetical protein
LILEVVLFGVAALWALAALPAAAVTLLKGRWALAVGGCVTLGFVWFLGAVARPERGSAWALRFGGPIADEPPSRKEARGIAIGVGVALALILLLGFFSARPAPILGVGGKALQQSVGGGGFGFLQRECERLAEDEWSCSRLDNQSSGSVSYRVRTRSLGCWTARREGKFAGEGGSPTRLDGCVNIFDYLTS